MSRHAHAMPFGAALCADGAVRFRLWAPAARTVDLCIEDERRRAELPMQAAEGGWFELVTAQAGAGSRYRYAIDGGMRVPDPASRFNPDDVHGASEVIDPMAYRWHAADWRGRPWHEAVIYELHLGTFSPEGDFDGLRRRLDHLLRLGVTALELMPVADFPGRRNWGYDGVLPYAPDAAYGRPEALKALVDAAHERGLMMLLDVVYNHFGPEGNYLHAYAPHFFSQRHETPWGAAINFDDPHARAVRDFFIHNALYWLGEYRFDGLRLDAVHAIADDSSPHILVELAAAVRAGPGRDRHIHLVLENDANEARFLARGPAGEASCHTAQWNDDIHHVLHVLLTGERDGYYADYAEAPAAQLGRALAEGFVYQGEPSPYRHGTPRGEASGGLPPAAFVDFLQTHDQVGNRAFGERIGALADPAALRAALDVLLLAPAPPMLFMGEEFASPTPFLFFCDFGPELARAVTEGRRREFARFECFADPEARSRIPDPGDPASFAASRLDWRALDAAEGAACLAHYRALLALRHAHIVPRLAGMQGHAARWQALGAAAVRVGWLLGDGSRLHLAANLGTAPVALAEALPGATLHENTAAAAAGPGMLPAGAVRWTLLEAAP